MSDEELRARFDGIEGYIEILAKAMAEQQLLVLRTMALQEAHFAALRDLLVRGGEGRTMLGQRIDSVYRTVLVQYRDHFEAFQQSGDVKKFLHSLGSCPKLPVKTRRV